MKVKVLKAQVNPNLQYYVDKVFHVKNYQELQLNVYKYLLRRVVFAYSKEHVEKATSDPLMIKRILNNFKVFYEVED